MVEIPARVEQEEVGRAHENDDGAQPVVEAEGHEHARHDQHDLDAVHEG